MTWTKEEAGGLVAPHMQISGSILKATEHGPPDRMASVVASSYATHVLTGEAGAVLSYSSAPCHMVWIRPNRFSLVLLSGLACTEYL